ncbi:MAG: fimbrillin family protein [Bacteroidales bacterium]|nr:fimbrillin family protein [Bacteroidales bacterium]
MKKFLFLTVAATMAFASCNKTEVVYTDGPQEIAMFAVNNVATKAPVADATFPVGDKMEVAAYSLTEGEGYFEQTTFSKTSTYWTGTPARFWPVTAATLNFLAVSEPASDSPLTIEFNDTYYASGAAVTLADNSSKQYDLMYAAGQGVRTTTAPEKVDMVFKHALSWINFKVKDAANTGKIRVKSLTLNDCYYTGNLLLTNSKYDQASVTSADVEAAWTRTGTAADMLVYGTEVLCTDTAQEYGTGLLVVPGATTGAGFTIVYTIANGADITFTTTEALTPVTWEAGKKYTYVIGFGALNEIAINPTVDVYITDLNSNSTNDDDIPVAI